MSAYLKNPDFEKINFSHMEFVSNFAFPILCKNKSIFEKYLEKFKDVEIRPIVGGSMVEQPFFGKTKFVCENAKKIHEFGFYLPNNPDLTKEEIEYICNIIEGKD